MNQFLSAVAHIAAAHPHRVAFCNSRDESLDYKELWIASEALACALLKDAKDSITRSPVLVCGHKSPLMLVGFLGALKAGRGFAPIDRSFPEERVRLILEQVGPNAPIVLTDDHAPKGVEAHAQNRLTVSKTELMSFVSSAREQTPREWACASTHWVKGDELFYLLFTSGSTGVPKGVPMTSCAVDAFMAYSNTFFGDGVTAQSASWNDPWDKSDSSSEVAPLVSFCRVPFSFDLSMNDVLSGLSSGATLFALEAEAEAEPARAFEALAKASPHLWISTPSFVEICLADPSFCPTLLPRLTSMILAGEVLQNATARRILARFPGLTLRNMYGPTESQAVSEIPITATMASSSEPLPVGIVNPEITIAIVDHTALDQSNGAVAPEVSLGEEGEVLIAGATVFPGYFKRLDLTERAFVTRLDALGVPRRFYRTGDRGFMDAKGRLYCRGRYDFQVKLHGVRIELGEIERLLCGMPAIDNAVVLPRERGGKVSYLEAHVLIGDPNVPKDREAARSLREELSRSLPDYMLPRIVRIHERFPLTTNGKVDRDALLQKERHKISTPQKPQKPQKSQKRDTSNSNQKETP